MLTTTAVALLLVWSLYRQVRYPHEIKLNFAGFFVGLSGLLLQLVLQ